MFPPIFRPTIDFFVRDSPRDVVSDVPSGFRGALQLALSGMTRQNRSSEADTPSHKTNPAETPGGGDHRETDSPSGHRTFVLDSSWDNSSNSEAVSAAWADVTSASMLAALVQAGILPPEGQLSLIENAAIAHPPVGEPVEYSIQLGDSETPESLIDVSMQLDWAVVPTSHEHGVDSAPAQDVAVVGRTMEGDDSPDSSVSGNTPSASAGEVVATLGSLPVTGGEWSTRQTELSRSGGGRTSSGAQEMLPPGPLPVPPTPKPPVPNGGLTSPLGGPVVVLDRVTEVSKETSQGVSASAVDPEASGISTRHILVDGARALLRLSVSSNDVTTEGLPNERTTKLDAQLDQAAEPRLETTILSSAFPGDEALATAVSSPAAEIEESEAVVRSGATHGANGRVSSDSRIRLSTVAASPTHPDEAMRTQVGGQIEDARLEGSTQTGSLANGTADVESTTGEPSQARGAAPTRAVEISALEGSLTKDSYQAGLARRQVPPADASGTHRTSSDPSVIEIERSGILQSVATLRSALGIDETRKQIEGSLRTLLFGRSPILRSVSSEESADAATTSSTQAKQPNAGDQADSAIESAEDSRGSTVVHPVAKSGAEGADRGLGTPVAGVRSMESGQDQHVAAKPAEPLPIKEQVESLVPRMRGDTATLRIEDANGKAAHIRVTVRGEQVHTRIIHESHAVAGQLTATSDELHEALTSQGFKDSGLSIKTPRTLIESNLTHASTRAMPLSETTEGADVREDRHHDPRQERREGQRHDRRDDTRESWSRRQGRSRDESRRHTQ